MFRRLLILLYFISLCNLFIATLIPPDDISAEFFITKTGHVHLNLTWQESNQISGVKIESLNETETCKISCSDYPTDTTTIFLPPLAHDTIKSMRANHDCIFQVNCWYDIILEDMQGNRIWNEHQSFTGCTKDSCLCEIRPPLPNFTIWGKVVSEDNIIINWSVNISDMINSTSIEDNVINISVFELNDLSVAWGGRHDLIKTDFFPLYINPNTKNILGDWKLEATSIFLPNHAFQIIAKITDSDNCSSKEEKFKLIVPAELNESENGSKMTMLLVIITLVGIICLIVLVLYKRLYWKNHRYHSIAANRISHIPMQSNIVYIEKDTILNNIDDFEICPSRITLSYEIGNGAFGKVYKGFLKYENGSTRIVAIKLLKKTYSNLEEEFLNEIETMKSVGKHKHIIELFGYCTKLKPMMLIMEYAGGGSLLDYLKRIGRKQGHFFPNNENDSFGFEAIKGTYLDIMFSGCSAGSSNSYISEPDGHPNILRPSLTDTMYTDLSGNHEELNCNELHNFALQIAKGMHYLEENGITHRDLAARNILITEKKLLKISDFGLSRTGIYIKKTNGKIPWKWLSIEAMLDHYYSSKSDVWAFGVVLWEIGSLGVSPPYGNISNSNLANYLLNGNRLEKPKICSDELYNLMTKCWKFDLNDRPSFDDILKILRPEGQNLYVHINSFGSNDVFSPSTKKILSNNLVNK